MKKLALVVFLVIFSTAAFGQNKHEIAKRVDQTNKELKPVEAYVDSIDKFVGTFEGPHQVITDVADYNESEKADWISFDSQEAYENDQRESYTTAFIWKKEGKVVQVNFTYSSPSGDWAQYVFCTFYPDGTLAKADRELRTFMGDIIVNRTYYYSSKGKLLKEATTYRDLATKKPVEKPESFQDIDVHISMKVNEIPFATMLSKSKM